MKTINVHSNQAECASTASWPECVEESYEQLVAAVTRFVANESTDNSAAV